MLSHLAMIVLAAATVVTSTETLAPSPGPRHQLVRDGQALATIVLPAKADKLEVLAATELRNYTKLITGVTLPIVHEPNKPIGYPLWLGQTEAAKSAKFDLSRAKLGGDGYAAKADGKGLIVIGRCPIGTLFGVYDLIEREFGVRWFLPDEKHEILTPGHQSPHYVLPQRQLIWVEAENYGTVIPKADTVSIGTFRREFIPSFEYRWVREGNWSLHSRMNIKTTLADGTPAGVNMKWHFHSHGELVPPAKYFKDHPEWFAMVKGKRHNHTDAQGLGHDSQLCTSNPEVIEKLAEGMIEALRADPTIDIISLSPNDGGGFCECENCIALDEPSRPGSAKYTNRLAVHNNAVAKLVAKEFPDVKIKVGAYSYYFLPPVQNVSDFQPNLLVQVARCAEQCRPINGEIDPAQRPHRTHRYVMKKWLAITGQLFVYEYYAKANAGKHRILRPMVHIIRCDIPWYRDHGVKGFYTQNFQQPWYQCPLNHYIAAKLVWNADLDVDWLINDFSDKFFENASEPMRDYLLGLEQAWIDRLPYCYPEVERTPIIFTKPIRDQLRAHLDKAQQMTNSEVVERRIAAVRRGFDECEKSISLIVERAKRRKVWAKMKADIKNLQEQNKLPEMKTLQKKLNRSKKEWTKREAEWLESGQEVLLQRQCVAP